MNLVKNIRSAICGILLSGTVLISAACMNNAPDSSGSGSNTDAGTTTPEPAMAGGKMEKATFAMGCFWHSEEMFSELKGVTEAVPGYCGGTEKNPGYEQVGTGTTRYAESVDVTYDPAVISYKQLLQVFFAEHDPTTPNYAAPDEGPQYRSIVFYRNAQQKKEADDYIASLTASKKYHAPIITEVTPYSTFYKAEAYHIHYYRKHPDEGYIAGVTRPEVEKFRKDFKDWLKPGMNF